jgi:hypothetical protein
MGRCFVLVSKHPLETESICISEYLPPKLPHHLR